ncbi:MAG: Fe-S cluster assembly protein SufB [Parachlamydiales bacterium]|nr:Fe-S cluster assembly protein SufB [Parachlamydiales bacterium]
MERMNFAQKKYPYGFVTDVETEVFPKGLDENVILAIARKKKEPSFIVDMRMEAFRLWKQMTPPTWGNVQFSQVDFQNMSYYARPKVEKNMGDPHIADTLEKLRLPVKQPKKGSNIAVDVVFDSVSLGTLYVHRLKGSGVILCSISEAIQKYPDLIEKYFGSVVSAKDNYYAALNMAVFSDGSFVYVPKNVRCPVDLSTYFRMNQKGIGQFERTLIIADNDSYVSYLEGCSAPSYSEHQLHAAVVELVALDRATIKYSTVQHWYPGDPKTKKGGIYNFVTKRGRCAGDQSTISWTQVEVGAAVTWKYPSCILEGKHSRGEFYSVALTNGVMQADTGTKMIHIGEQTTSTVISKSISAEESKNTFRSLIMITPQAKEVKSYSQCDSLLVGETCATYTFPTLQSANKTASVAHEATVFRLDKEQIFYLQTRGFSEEEAISLIVHGFCHEVIEKLPLEFSAEAIHLLSLKLENSVR